MGPHLTHLLVAGLVLLVGAWLTGCQVVPRVAFVQLTGLLVIGQAPEMGQ